ncbi:hypothetical protein AVEN_117213-1 [Araneus ventricosus]|uniref:Uncharacterized protein n=1 Tax=Araneus ventricosus TaxID=182803 RepID=A0A4Y2AY36_ARAVE|nr:hypothetical protein AVEN_117213-1 [Araneus ventricosus]
MTRTTPELAPPLQTSVLHQREDVGSYVRFSVQQAPYTADLQWNRVFSLRPFGSEVETFPRGHRGLQPWSEYVFQSRRNETDLVILGYGQMTGRTHEPHPLFEFPLHTSVTAIRCHRRPNLNGRLVHIKCGIVSRMASRSCGVEVSRVQCRHRCYPRHLSRVRRYDFHSKIALVYFQERYQSN